MVLRTARKGKSAGKQFYGCKKYPNCKGTRDYNSEDLKNNSSANLENKNSKHSKLSYKTDKDTIKANVELNTTDITDKDSINDDLMKERINRYKNLNDGNPEVDSALKKTMVLFSVERIRDYIFEPFRVMFLRKASSDDGIRAIITQTAVVNAVLAGLPGKMGIGVAVSIALEAYMAYSIGRYVGVKIDEPKDVFKYFGLISGILLTVLMVFKQLLSLFFSLFSVIPMVNPLIFAELVVTTFVGVIFWVGFKEVKKKGSFSVPFSALVEVSKETKKIVSYQINKFSKLMTKNNILIVVKRMREYYTGEVVVKTPVIRDNVYTSIAMVALKTRDYDKLEGPMGEMFLDAIRERFSKLKNAEVEEIAEHMQNYDEEQMQGVITMIKGKMFEHMVEKAENTDGDRWVAKLFENESHPSTDIIFENSDTHERLAVSLKATDSPELIEKALSKYPSDEVITTNEVYDNYFKEHDMVSSSGISNEYVTNVTEENFDKLLHQSKTHQDFDGGKVVGAGAAVALTVSLWPFVVAYLRGKISSEYLKKACVHILGVSGERMAVKLLAFSTFGPVILWGLLATTVIQVTEGGGFATEE
jgi:hypothetical protein